MFLERTNSINLLLPAGAVVPRGCGRDADELNRFTVGLCIAAIGIASNVAYVIPLITATHSVVAMALLLCCVFVIASISVRSRRASAPVWAWSIAGFWPIGLLGLQAIALIRTMIAEDFLIREAIYFLVMLVMLVSVFWRASRYLYVIGHHGDYWRYMAWSVIVLCVASLSLKASLGLFTSKFEDDPYSFDPSMSLAMLGITSYRTAMPLLSGINTAGLIFGMGACCSAILATVAIRMWGKLVFLLVGLAAMAGLLWVDTRGAIMGVLVVFFYTLLGRQIWIGIVVLLFSGIGLFLSVGNLEDAANLGREGVDITSSRILIWDVAFDNLFDPKLIHLIGYGAWGQYVSGVSAGFEGVFRANISFEMASLHNALLQTTFDSGYLGLVFFVASWYTLIRTAGRQYTREKNESTALKLAMAIYIVATGFSEAFAGYSNPSSMFLYVGVLVGFFTELTYQREVNSGVTEKRKANFSLASQGRVLNG